MQPNDLMRTLFIPKNADELFKFIDAALAKVSTFRTLTNYGSEEYHEKKLVIKVPLSVIRTQAHKFCNLPLIQGYLQLPDIDEEAEFFVEIAHTFNKYQKDWIGKDVWKRGLLLGGWLGRWIPQRYRQCDFISIGLRVYHATAPLNQDGTKPLYWQYKIAKTRTYTTIPGVDEDMDGDEGIDAHYEIRTYYIAERFMGGTGSSHRASQEEIQAMIELIEVISTGSTKES